MFVAGTAYDEAELRSAVAASLSWSEVLRRLGRRAAGGNHQTVKSYAARWDISTEHFDPHAASRCATRFRGRPLEEVLIERSTYQRGTLKKRLFREGVKQRRCELCGQGEEWRGRRMSLILDHVNGVSDDNRLENLQIVCPNCAATLDTHCGRNPALSKPRDCRVCREPFIPRYTQQRFCSTRCADRGKSRAVTGLPKPERRKVERPPFDLLMRELAETSYSAVGREYGVSDNAVRKWVRMYERAMHLQTGGTR